METEGAECNGSVKLEKSPSDGLITYKRRRDDESSTDATKVLERPGRNGDIGWKHCVKVGADLMCNWCGYQTCGGITKIKYHLAGGFQVWKCPKVPAAVSKSIKEARLIKMRMRREKRLAQNCRSDGKEMNNPCKVDLVYADSTKCDQKIQVECIGIFNLKADKQFENTKTATESSKSADHCSGMPTQLPKTDMNKIQVESAGIFNSKGAKQFGNTKTAAKSSESADHCSGIASQLPKIDMTKIQVESAGIFNPKADMQFENTKTATKSSKSADHCSGTASQLPKTDMTKVESAGIFNLKADKQFENTKTATKSSKSADHRLRTASQLPKTDMIKVLERPGRNGDIGWKHCLKVGADLMCNWCGYQTCGGITKIKYHLAGGFQVWKCPKVPAAVSKSIKEAQLIKMRMRRKKRLAQNCRSDGKEMNNPWKVDLVYADSTKCNQKIQVESAGIFNLKADKQFENTKTATESSKSADHCSGMPTQLPKTDMNKIQVESAGIFNSKGAKQFGNTKTAAKSLESADHCSGIASQLPKIDMTKIQVESAGIFNPKADMQFENTKTATKSLKSADHCSGTASQLPKTDMTKIQVESAGIFNLKADKQFENTKTATKSSKSADHRLRTASQLPKTDMIKVLERPGRDIGWKHCVKVGADLMCNWCGYQTCGGITKIKYHLAGGFQVWKCPKVPAAVSKSIKEAQLIKMRMRREKRLAQNCRSDGKEMNNPCKVDIVYADSMKCEKKIQVESAGIFNPKADKQFENTKAATISSKSADQCPGTASQLPKIDMTKLKIIGPAETVSYTDSHPERHDRICRCWRSAIECQLKLSYVTPGQGIWNILHAALSFDHSQLSHKLMMNDVIMDNEQLKDIQLGDSELKLQPQELDSLSANEQIVLESTASYHKEDTNTRKCEKAFLEILISAKFALLCDFLLGIFDENITKSFLDFSLIDSKLKSGDYEQSAELFNQDVEQIWNKVQKIGEKMTTLASNLSSCHKQETGQVGVIQKNSIVPHATKQFTVGPDCSTKPDHMEASNPNCASTYNKCGTEANGGNSLPCGGCDAIYHFSSVDNSIREIPNRNWHCAACPSNDKDSDPVCTGNKKELDEVSVSKEDLAENGSGIKTATNLEETSVSSMESADPVEPSKTVNSRLCKICRTREAEDQKFLVCGHTHCPCKFYRIRCLRTNQIASAQQQNRPCWYCPSCICRGCLCDRNDDDGIVLCDWCDEAYHTFCMPKRQRYCVPCNDARARDRKRRYDEWILQQHKNEGEQSREAFWPIDLLLSAAERLSEDRSTLQR